MDAARGSPSATRAIIVIKIIFAGKKVFFFSTQNFKTIKIVGFSLKFFACFAVFHFSLEGYV
jgi:hypothetical protein